MILKVGNHLRPGELPPVDPVPDYVYRYLPASIEKGLYNEEPDYRAGKVGERNFPIVANNFSNNSDAYILDDISDRIAPGEGDMTISFWIKSNNGRMIVVKSGDGGSGDNSFRIRTLGTGSIRFDYNGASFDVAFNRGEWNFFVYELKNGNELKIYKNNVLESDLSPNYDLIDTGLFRLGGSNTAGDKDLHLDDLRVCHKGLTATERTNLYSFGHNYYPTQGSNTSAFYDPQILGTITASAGDVSQLDDITGNYDLTPINLSETIQTDNSYTLASINVLYNAGLERSVENTNVDLDSSGNFAVHIFARVEDGGAAVDIAGIFALYGSKTELYLQREQPNASQWRAFLQCNGVGTGDADIVINPELGELINTTKLYSIIFDFDSGEIEYYINGSMVGKSGDYKTKFDTTGLTLRYGAPVDNRRGCTSYLGQFILRNNANKTDFYRDIGFIMWTYGYQDELPEDFIYKNKPPRKVS